MGGEGDGGEGGGGGEGGVKGSVGACDPPHDASPGVRSRVMSGVDVSDSQRGRAGDP